MGAWWYFRDATIVRVDGTLIPPTALPTYVPDRLIALEVARQCFYGVAGKCKAVNQRPYPYLPFKIGDFYFQNWPSLEKFAREIETMNLPGKGVLRYWDPHDRVRGHLAHIHDKVVVAYYHQTSEEDQYYLCPESWEEVQFREGRAQTSQGTSLPSSSGIVTNKGDDDPEETNEVIKKKLLKGLPTGPLKVQPPSTTTIAMVSPPTLPTTLSFDSSVAGSSSLGPNVVVTPSVEVPPVFKVPPQGGVFSPITPPLSSPPTLCSPLVATSLLNMSVSASFRTLIRHNSTTTPVTSSLVTTPPTNPLFPIPISPILSSSILSTPSLFTSFSQSTPLTTKVDTTISLVSIPTSALSTSSSLPSTTIASQGDKGLQTKNVVEEKDGAERGGEVHTRLEMETTLPLDLLATIKVSLLLSLKPSLWGSPTFTLPTPTLSWASSLIISLPALSTSTAIGCPTSASTVTIATMVSATVSCVASIISYHILCTVSPSREQTRVGPNVVGSVKSANRMFEDAVERMQRELSQAHEKIVVSPSIGTEIQGILKDLYRLFVQVEEAQTTSNQAYHQIKDSLGKINEWETKLATLGNVARRNLLPNVPLLTLDEVVTCENVLAKLKQFLEDGDTPLVTSNNHLKLSSENILSLFAIVGLPQVVKQDNTLCTEEEFETILGDFTNQFSRQLASVEEQGNWAIHEFIVGITRKAERVQ
eukprot:Gb_22790 [translate_table: standard]